MLKWPVVELTPFLANVAAESFTNTITQNHLTCHACAIMTTHIHMVMRREALRGEEMIAAYQHDSLDALRRAAGLDDGHPVWGGPGWKVYLSSRNSVLEKIRYVENNPVEVGQRRQQWPFVIPYIG